METTLTTANYSEFKKLQSFENKNAMDVAVRKFLYTFSHKLTEGAKKVLKVLQKHACKIAGVAWMKYDTIAKITEISKRTVIRAIKLLETFGVIEKQETLRVEGQHRGGNGHNVYIIREVADVKELPETKSVTPPVTPPLSPRQDGEIPTGTSDGESKQPAETKSFEPKPSKRKKYNNYNKFKNWVSKAKPQVNSASMTFEEAKKAELEAKSKKQAVRNAPMPKHMANKPKTADVTDEQMAELAARLKARK